jgi:hypothetical protein
MMNKFEKQFEKIHSSDKKTKHNAPLSIKDSQAPEEASSSTERAPCSSKQQIIKNSNFFVHQFLNPDPDPSS